MDIKDIDATTIATVLREVQRINNVHQRQAMIESLSHQGLDKDLREKVMETITPMVDSGILGVKLLIGKIEEGASLEDVLVEMISYNNKVMIGISAAANDLIQKEIKRLSEKKVEENIDVSST